MSSEIITNHGGSSSHIDPYPGSSGDVEMGVPENLTEVNGTNEDEMMLLPASKGSTEEREDTSNLRNTHSLRLRRLPSPPPFRTPSWPRSTATRPTRAPTPPLLLPPLPITPISNSPLVANQPRFWTFLCNFFSVFFKFVPAVKIKLVIKVGLGGDREMQSTGPSSGSRDDQPIADQGSSNDGRPVEVIIDGELDQLGSNTEGPTRPALEASTSPTGDVKGRRTSSEGYNKGRRKFDFYNGG